MSDKEKSVQKYNFAVGNDNPMDWDDVPVFVFTAGTENIVEPSAEIVPKQQIDESDYHVGSYEDFTKGNKAGNTSFLPTSSPIGQPTKGNFNILPPCLAANAVKPKDQDNEEGKRIETKRKPCDMDSTEELENGIGPFKRPKLV